VHIFFTLTPRHRAAAKRRIIWARAVALASRGGKGRIESLAPPLGSSQ